MILNQTHYTIWQFTLSFPTLLNSYVTFFGWFLNLLMLMILSCSGSLGHLFHIVNWTIWVLLKYQIKCPVLKTDIPKFWLKSQMEWLRERLDLINHTEIYWCAYLYVGGFWRLQWSPSLLWQQNHFINWWSPIKTGKILSKLFLPEPHWKFFTIGLFCLYRTSI